MPNPDRFGGTTPVRDALRFDEGRLAEWLRDNVPGASGPLRVEQFKGGQSNPTYKLTTPAGIYVLRRKPPGPLLAGAHAVEREAMVLSALASVSYPVAAVRGVCLDEGVIGTRFYVMDYIEGRIFWDARLPGVDRRERPVYFRAMNAAIASLHRVDYRAIGLADFGREGRYFERQIARWTKQYVADTEGGRDPNLDRLIEWLPLHIPPSEETCLIHGDFRIDNLIFHPTQPRIIAVLDWELATLGSPLGDFAYHLMMYRMPSLVISGLLEEELPSQNIPMESEYVAWYCEQTSRAGISNLEFYIAFNLFRLAAIFHGIKARHVRGTAASVHASDAAAALPRLAELAWQQACGCRSLSVAGRRVQK